MSRCVGSVHGRLWDFIGRPVPDGYVFALAENEKTVLGHSKTRRERGPEQGGWSIKNLPEGKIVLIGFDAELRIGLAFAQLALKSCEDKFFNTLTTTISVPDAAPGRTPANSQPGAGAAPLLLLDLLGIVAREANRVITDRQADDVRRRLLAFAESGRGRSGGETLPVPGGVKARVISCSPFPKAAPARGEPRFLIRAGRNSVGYIDISGAVVIPPTFSAGGEFSEGLAPVSNGAKWGFINEAGKYVIPPTFFAASPFSGGFSGVATELRERGATFRILNRNGILVGREFDAPVIFSEGLSLQARAGRFGFIDTTGDFAIPAIFEGAGGFHEGCAPVQHKGRWGYINRDGEFVVKAEYALPSPGNSDFSEGLAAVYRDGKAGYVDRYGAVAIPFFESGGFSGGVFREGLAPVRSRDGQWGYIDKQGREIIQPRYANALSFSNGLAAVEATSRPRSWGYIDRFGKFVIPATLHVASTFEGGLAYVLLDANTAAYMTPEGKIVWRSPER